MLPERLSSKNFSWQICMTPSFVTIKTKRRSLEAKVNTENRPKMIMRSSCHVASVEVVDTFPQV